MGHLARPAHGPTKVVSVVHPVGEEAGEVDGVVDQARRLHRLLGRRRGWAEVEGDGEAVEVEGDGESAISVTCWVVDEVAKKGTGEP
jgi:hypothetical protein